MKPIFTLLLLLFSAIVIAEPITCTVISVTDGDTLNCLTAGKRQIRVRLVEIDAPERGQPYGNRARQTLNHAVYRKQVTLLTAGTDSYGRLLATVYLAGQNQNLMMVNSGMAWAYRQYVRDARYIAAENRARTAKIGLWSDREPLEPWQWRRR